MSVNETKAWTVAGILKTTSEFFESKGIDSARLDAEVLLSKVLGRDRIFLYTDPKRVLADLELSTYRELVRRRASREPMAYILGVKEFFSRSFRVGPGVLVPRPETEVLIEETLRIVRKTGREKAELKILDLCTGSGCIAVTVAKELPQVHVLASDISKDTISFALENAASHEVQDHVEFREGDLFDVLNKCEKFDAVLCNPPYIKDGCDSVMTDVKRFEPHTALYAGADGLDVIRRIAGGLAAVLNEEGFALFEIGAGQAEKVCEIFRAAGFAFADAIEDYAGIARVVRVSHVVLPVAVSEKSGEVTYELFPEQQTLVAEGESAGFKENTELTAAQYSQQDATENIGAIDDEQQKILDQMLDAYAEGGEEEPE